MSEKKFHWALLYTKGEKSKWIFHLSKNGKNFDCFRVDNVYHAQLIATPLYIGPTILNINDLDDLCQEVTERQEFYTTVHNCQNWCTKVIQHLGYIMPKLNDKDFIYPSEHSSGLLWILKTPLEIIPVSKEGKSS